MKEEKLVNEFELFLNSVERRELNEDQQLLLSSFSGGSSNSCSNLNCSGGNCIAGCSK